MYVFHAYQESAALDLQDRAIVPWLVQAPSKQECTRARRLTAGQMNKLETAWKADPDATLETVQEEAATQKDLLRGALRYDNAFEYQNVLAPLVQIEADYDKVPFLNYYRPFFFQCQ